MAITTPPISMHPIIRLYKKVICYFTDCRNPSDRERCFSAILKMKDECRGLWWQDVENDLNGTWHFLFYDDPGKSFSRDSILIAAFKDLSSLKDPEAMQTFCMLRQACRFDEELDFVWARNVHRRKDGSAVLTLHVSNLGRFNSLYNRHGNIVNGAITRYRSHYKYQVI